MAIWSILGTLEIFYGHLVYFVVIWYIFPRFGILDQEKSGNPGSDPSFQLFSMSSLIRLPSSFPPKYQSNGCLSIQTINDYLLEMGHSVTERAKREKCRRYNGTFSGAPML
jgi:hypothetical protein